MAFVARSEVKTVTYTIEVSEDMANALYALLYCGLHYDVEVETGLIDLRHALADAGADLTGTRYRYLTQIGPDGIKKMENGEEA